MNLVVFPLLSCESLWRNPHSCQERQGAGARCSKERLLVRDQRLLNYMHYIPQANMHSNLFFFFFFLNALQCKCNINTGQLLYACTLWIQNVNIGYSPLFSLAGKSLKKDYLTALRTHLLFVCLLRLGSLSQRRQSFFGLQQLGKVLQISTDMY